MSSIETGDFPFTKAEEGRDGMVLRRNEVFGISILQAPATLEAQAFYKVSRMVDQDGGGEAEVAVVAHDRAAAQTAYADLWMRAVAMDIGLGFHLDTRAASYTPPLGPDLAAQYDGMIDFCHGHLDNPYAPAFEAWEEAGLISPSPTA